MTQLSCPSEDRLRLYLVGQTSELEAQVVENHLPHCPGCLDHLHQCEDGNDEFVRAVRSSENTPVPRNPILDQLRLRLRAVVPAGTGNTTLNVSTATATPPQDNGLADVLALLAPAQEVNELGRLRDYRVLRMLGGGGMGVVLEAADPALQRRVAIKLMRAALMGDPQSRERFLREARLMANLHHDHIVTIHQVGEERGLLFLVMPLLQGESLEARLAREGKLPSAEVLRIGRETALGLVAAHAQGVIHRDIKPANLWLEAPTGRIKILDFGLARPVASAHELTHPGTVLGTPAYMGPEQLEGQPAGPPADLFSLGCVLYRLATGQPAFPGTNVMAILRALATVQPPPAKQLNAEVSPALSELIQRLLAKNPKDRPATAQGVADMLAELERVPQTVGHRTAFAKTGTPLLSPPEQRGQKPTRVPRRFGYWLAGVVGLLVLAAALIGQITFQTRDGTLVLDVLEPDAKVFINGEERIVVIDSKKLGRIELVPGKYQVAVKRGAEELLTTEVTLKSGQEKVLHVTYKPAVAAPPKTKDNNEVKTQWAPLDQLKYENIPATERFAGQPKELVQVLGRHAWRYSSADLYIYGINNTAFPALQLGPDGKSVLALGAIWGRNETFFWDAATGLPKMESLPIAPAGWTSDFKFVASTWTAKEGDNYCQVWDVAARRQRCELVTPPGEAFLRVAIAPNGKWAASANSNRYVTLWDMDTGKASATLSALQGLLSFSADSKQLACCYSTGTEVGKKSLRIQVWDVATKKEVAHLKKPMDDYVVAIAFSPDGKTIAAGGQTAGEGAGRVHLWNVDSGKEGPMLWTKEGVITRFAWSPDSKTLACGTQGPVRLYNVATGAEQKVLTGHGGAVCSLTFAPDGKRLASAGLDRTIRVWDVVSGKQLNEVAEPISFLALSPDDRTLVIQRAKGNEVEFWDIVTGNQKKYPPWLISKFSRFTGPAVFMRDGKTLAALIGAQTFSFDLHAGERTAEQFPEIGGSVSSLYGAADGKTVAFSAGAQYVTDVVLHNTATGKTYTLKGAGSGKAAFSPDSKTLAVNKVGGVSLWDVATGKQLEPLKMQTGQPAGGTLAFSRDGKRLAVAPYGSSVIKVWDPASRAELATFPISDFELLGWIGFGADDRTVISASRYGRITLRFSATERHEIRLPTMIDNFALSSNGRYAFTSNANGTVYVLRLDVPAQK